MEIDLMHLESMLRNRIDRASVENKSLTLPASVVGAASDRVEQQRKLREYERRIFCRKLREYIQRYSQKHKKRRSLICQKKTLIE